MNDMEMLERAARALVEAHDKRECRFCETCNYLRPVLEVLDELRAQRRTAGPRLSVPKNDE